ILDKPHGFSSNAALQKVRWLLNAEKAGHTGSLDPLATGVLPLCFGEATKFSQYLLDADKAYETLAQLGVTTSTGDAEGEVLERRDVAVTRADIEALLRSEEHTSELQSRENLVCRLLLETKKAH